MGRSSSLASSSPSFVLGPWMAATNTSKTATSAKEAHSTLGLHLRLASEKKRPRQQQRPKKIPIMSMTSSSQ